MCLDRIISSYILSEWWVDYPTGHANKIWRRMIFRWWRHNRLSGMKTLEYFSYIHVTIQRITLETKYHVTVQICRCHRTPLVSTYIRKRGKDRFNLGSTNIFILWRKYVHEGMQWIESGVSITLRCKSALSNDTMYCNGNLLSTNSNPIWDKTK